MVGGGNGEAREELSFSIVQRQTTQGQGMGELEIFMASVSR